MSAQRSATFEELSSKIKCKLRWPADAHIAITWSDSTAARTAGVNGKAACVTVFDDEDVSLIKWQHHMALTAQQRDDWDVEHCQWQQCSSSSKPNWTSRVVVLLCSGNYVC